MCLITDRNNGVKVAETDIDVFKVFRRVNGRMSILYTGPYQEYYYYGNLNGLYTCNGFDGFTFDNQPDDDWAFENYWKGFVPMPKEWEEKKRKEFEKYRFIFVGYHSFKNFQDALKEVVDLKFDDNFDEEEYDVIHCTIPKGTKYYEGLFDKKECYCSEQIKLNYN